MPAKANNVAISKRPVRNSGVAAKRLNGFVFQLIVIESSLPEKGFAWVPVTFV
jgi:hypothetical protein